MVTFFDIMCKSGHPVRTTVSEMGPLLLARLLDLNDTQEGVLQIVFKHADENGLLLLDFDDLTATLQYAYENSKELSGTYGNVSKQSVGAIQRQLLSFEAQGANHFFEEHMDVLLTQIDEYLEMRGAGIAGTGARVS